MNLQSLFLLSLLLGLSCPVTAFVLPFSTQHWHSSPTQRFYRDDTSGSEEASSLTTPSSSLPNTNSDNSPSWKRTDQLWNEEWHDAFIRNGLIDFTPPMTDYVFCLMVGDGLKSSSSHNNNCNKQKESLPWDPPKEEKPSKRTSSVLLHSDHKHQDEQQPGHNKLFGDPSTSSRLQFRYDCIVDTSWMDDLAQKETFGHKSSIEFIRNSATIDGLLKNAGTLLVEATCALQEHGIYVAITKKSMAATPILKEYLIRAGHSLGMQWQFDLEEISRGDVHVSVARKYYTGTLPSSHGLATSDS